MEFLFKKMDNSQRQKSQILSLLRQSDLLSDNHSVEMEELSGDGSDRIFYRIRSNGGKLIAAFPSPTLAAGFAEQTSAFRVGVHLFDKKVAVPEIFAFDKENGLLLFEDLGNVHLQSIVQDSGSKQEVESLYVQAIDSLIIFQLEGCKEFDTRFCWDTPRYDQQLMLERESGYFSRAFCHDYMGKISDAPHLPREFQAIARRAAQEPAGFLLHRDFQSRNLMVHDGRVRIIDFQGARLGPLGYDLASLLLDPYAGLSEDLQETLLNYYMKRVSEKISFDQRQFREGYYCLALQRNLQIIGAFAFLSQVKGKVFFEQYLFPAVQCLAKLLRRSRVKKYPSLVALVDELAEELGKSQYLRINE